nr:MAG TPA: hypothetical protein [Caudoviricetes sp.]
MFEGVSYYVYYFAFSLFIMMKNRSKYVYFSCTSLQYNYVH